MIGWLTVFIDLPAEPALAAAGEAFWLEVTGSGLSAPRGPDGEFATLLPADGDPYLRFQRVRQGAGGRHLDLHVDGGSVAEAAARATSLGARVQHVEEGLTVLESPGGQPFCLVDRQGEAMVPEPVRFDTGGAHRLDQICLDIPADRFDAESSFWSALTGWALKPGVLPEFAYLERAAGIPVRILLQRRAESAPGDRVGAHIDFDCVDVPALTERHLDAGAQLRARFPRWTTLIDPAGQPYCLTARNPRTP